MEHTLLSWKVVGSSVIGTSHQLRRVPCQDTHGFKSLPDGTLLVAVADGAGSALRADLGSRIAAHGSLEFLDSNLAHTIPESDEAWELLLHDAFRHARLALEANVGEGQLHDLATTLLLVVAAQEILATAQIGDGAIVCRDELGALRVLTPVSDCEFINETNFLTGCAFLDNTHFSVSSSVTLDAIAVFSDGIQHLSIQSSANLAQPGFFNPLFTFAAAEVSDVAELEAFLASAQVNERTDDDKTLVLAVRRAAL